VTVDRTADGNTGAGAEPATHSAPDVPSATTTAVPAGPTPASPPPAAAPSAEWEGRVLPANKDQPLPDDLIDLEEARRAREHRLWWRWVQVTGLAWGVAAAPFAFTPEAVQNAGGYAQYVLAGVLQWLVLRRYVPHAARWVIATVLAAAGGLAIYVALSTLPAATAIELERNQRDAISALADGVLLGIAQTVVLWRWFRRARGWLIVTVLVTLVIAVATLFGTSEPSTEPAFGSRWLEALVGVPLLAFIGAIVTVPQASVLIRLTRRPKPIVALKTPDAPS
jgi:hypothetical protein